MAVARISSGTDLCLIVDSVKVTLAKAPAQTESKSNPKHKKNPDLGSKTTVYGPTVYVEQEDAVSFGDNEEVRWY